MTSTITADAVREAIGTLYWLRYDLPDFRDPTELAEDCRYLRDDLRDGRDPAEVALEINELCDDYDMPHLFPELDAVEA